MCEVSLYGRKVACPDSRKRHLFSRAASYTDFREARERARVALHFSNAPCSGIASVGGVYIAVVLSSYTKVYSVIYDSESVPE
jgi:hypothetical protein